VQSKDADTKRVKKELSNNVLENMKPELSRVLYETVYESTFSNTQAAMLVRNRIEMNRDLIQAILLSNYNEVFNIIKRNHVDLKYIDLFDKDGIGRDTLGYATLSLKSDFKINPQIVNLLIDKGEFSSKNLSEALLNVLQVGCNELIKPLLDHGADVNYFDGIERNPLAVLIYAEKTNFEAIKLLIENGADINKVYKNEENVTLFSVYEKLLGRGNQELIHFVQEQNDHVNYKMHIKLLRTSTRRKYPTEKELFKYLKYKIFYSTNKENDIDLEVKDLILKISAYLNYNIFKKFKLDVFEDSKNKDDKRIADFIFDLDISYYQIYKEYFGNNDFHSINDFRYNFDHIVNFKIALLKNKKRLSKILKNSNFLYIFGELNNQTRGPVFEYILSQYIDQKFFLAPILMGEVYSYNYKKMYENNALFKKLNRSNVNIDNIANVILSFLELSLDGRYAWKLETFSAARI